MTKQGCPGFGASAGGQLSWAMIESAKGDGAENHPMNDNLVRGLVYGIVIGGLTATW